MEKVEIFQYQEKCLLDFLCAFNSLIFCFYLNFLVSALDFQRAAFKTPDIILLLTSECFNQPLHAVDYSYQLCVTKKEKSEMGKVMKEDEILKLEAGKYW